MHRLHCSVLMRRSKCISFFRQIGKSMRLHCHTQRRFVMRFWQPGDSIVVSLFRPMVAAPVRTSQSFRMVFGFHVFPNPGICGSAVVRLSTQCLLQLCPPLFWSPVRPCILLVHVLLARPPPIRSTVLLGRSFQCDMWGRWSPLMPLRVLLSTIPHSFELFNSRPDSTSSLAVKPSLRIAMTLLPLSPLFRVFADSINHNQVYSDTSIRESPSLTLL
jgi:hypothetical protein